MQQYYVPQFIESESKIVGPLSLKQFFILFVPVVLVGILYFIFKSLIIAIGAGVILVGGGVMFAFSKFQGQSLTSIVNYGFMFLLGSKKYLWEKKGTEQFTFKEVEKIAKPKENIIPQKKTEESRLKRLSWEIQTKSIKNIKEKVSI